MVKETTIICIDISDYMGHHDSPKYLAQLDGLELYLQLILKPHSDHYVGVYGLAGHFGSLIVEPTYDISDIMTKVRSSRICMQGEIFIISALNHIMDRHKAVLTRMVLFIGGPLWDPRYQPLTYHLVKYSIHQNTVPSYTCLGTKFKEMGVAVDVINFGTKQEGFKKHTLCVFLAAANNNDNTRMLDRSGHHDLDASSFLALLGKGRTGLETVMLMQGDDFQTAKNQFEKVHGDRFHHQKKKPDDKGHDEGRERYGDRGDRYDRKQDDSGNDDTRDPKRKRDDKSHDEGRERYGDRGDRYGRKQDDRGKDDTRDRKRKRDDNGHDEGKETYRDRGDTYGRKRDYRCHDEGREIYGDRGDRHDQKQDDTTICRFRIRFPVDISSNSSIPQARGHDDGRERYRDRGDGHGRRQDDNMMRVGKDIGIEVMGMAENKIIEVMMRDGKYIEVKVIGMAEKRDYRGHES